MRVPFSLIQPNGAPPPVFDPATLALTSWLRGSYGGMPWVGEASAGISLGKDVSTAGFDPSVGSAVNGFTPADFDGTQWGDQSTNCTVLYGSDLSAAFLFYADTAPAPFFPQLDGNFMSDDADAEIDFGINTSGIVGNVYTGAAHVSVQVACGTGAWHFAQFKLTGGLLYARVDSGSWSSVACGAPDFAATGGCSVGKSFGAFAYFDGKMLEVMTAAVALSDGDFDDIISYINARYALSL